MADPSAPPAPAAEVADAQNQGTANPLDGLCFEDNGVTEYRSFDDMGLSKNLLRGVYRHGFERPSAIQQRAIVPVSKGGDVIAQAPSGTGKTGAFSIGALSRIDVTEPSLQVLIISPVRELADQSHKVITSFGHFLVPEGSTRKLSAVYLGGTQLRDDIRTAQEGSWVASGTPGRVNDLVVRGALRMDKLKVVVLDEADNLLSCGFQDQIHELLRYLPKDVQMCLFSATMPEQVLELAKKIMINPTSILVKKEQLSLEGIKQFYVKVNDEGKAGTVMDLYKFAAVAQSVIFCNSRRRVDWLAARMTSAGHEVAAVHAEMDRAARTAVMSDFITGHTRVLVTTDLLARGIDVQHVSIVINFDLPRDKEQYLHRIGRGGRYGKKGVAINFVTDQETQDLLDLERFYGVKIDELPLDFHKYLSA